MIIRNLSFKISEDEIKNVFSKYGNIVEISLPKKENGKLKGFAFLSYDNVGSSLKAIKYINGKEVGGRVVAVDFSISKKDYIQHSVKNGELYASFYFVIYFVTFKRMKQMKRKITMKLLIRKSRMMRIVKSMMKRMRRWKSLTM